MRREHRPRITWMLVLLAAIAGLLTGGCRSRVTGQAASSHDEPFTPLSMATTAAIVKSPVPRAPTPTPSGPNSEPCRVQQLALTYYGGGAGEGNDFGAIQIRNVSGAPCHLLGPIQVLGLDRQGKPVTQTLSYPVEPHLNLSPRAPAQAPGRSSTVGVTAVLGLAASYRDDPSSQNGLCQQHRVVPATWDLRFRDGSRDVANASIDIGYPAFSSLLTCSGQLDAPTLITAE